MNQRNYYAILPAHVRYDKRLSANAKLLYAEITSLCNERGYCWATNAYFAEQYDVHKNTVSAWISQLADLGYLTVRHVEKEGGSFERQLSLPEAPETPLHDSIDPPTSQDVPPSMKSCTPLNENREHNNKANTKENISSSSSAPGAPPTGKSVGMTIDDLFDKPFPDLTKGEFRKCVDHFAPMHSQGIRDEFFTHWTMKTASGRLRFQEEKVWDFAVKLQNWKRKQEEIDAREAARKAKQAGVNGVPKITDHEQQLKERREREARQKARD